ncbi:YadA-like family protein [Lysobacter sp. A421]
MNKIYSTVWNAKLGQLVVASELAKGGSVAPTGAGRVSGPRLGALAVALAVLLQGWPPGAHANTLEDGTETCIGGAGLSTIGRIATNPTVDDPEDGTGSFSTVAGCEATGKDQTAATVYGAWSSVTGKGGAAFGFNSQAGQWATAVGLESRATGRGSTALGYGVIASGLNAVAIGGSSSNVAGESLSVLNSTTASGVYSIAIGASNSKGAQATANSAIAIGGNAASSGLGTVALGASSVASAERATALGVGAAAAGVSSVALGDGAVAAGDRAVAIGNNTLAPGTNSIAMGYQATANEYAISLGSGSDATGDNSLAVGRISQATGLAALAMGYQAAASAEYATAVGSGADATGVGSLALGNVAKATAEGATAVGKDATAGGVNALAIGTGAQASGVNSISIGTGNQVSGNNSGAIGDPTVITGAGSYSLGNDNTIDADEAGMFGNNNVLAAAADGSRIVGNGNNVAVADAFVIGNGADVTVAGGVALGSGSVSDTAAGVAGYVPTGADAAGSAAIAATVATRAAVDVGSRQITGVAAGAADDDAVNVSQLSALADTVDASATHYYSVNDNGVQGGNYNNDGATGINAIAAGVNAVANAQSSVAMGTGSAASGARGVAIGSLAKSQFADAIAIGSAASAGTINSIAIGNNATLSGAQLKVAQLRTDGLGFPTDNTSGGANPILFSSVVLGDNAASAGAGVALGSHTDADGQAAVAIGMGAHAHGGSTLAIGVASYAEGVYSTALGRMSVAQGSQSLAIGQVATAIGSGSVAIGDSSYATGDRSVALGSSSATSQAQDTTTNTRAVGADSLALGTSAAAFTNSGIAAGRNAVAGVAGSATAISDIAIGTGAQATGGNSVAIGTGAQSSGVSAISIGTGNQVSGNNSGAIGDPTVITGSGSYSLGNDNTIDADDAGTFGNNNVLAVGAAGSRIVGNGNNVDVADALVIGNGADVTVAGGVALGSGSVSDTAAGVAGYVPTGADAAGTAAIAATVATRAAVDVGSRQITGVAAGSADDDAVNVSQLSALADTVDATATHYYSVNDNGVQGGNYDNDGATGVNALAAGVDASATVDSGTALGNGAVAGAQAGDVALGSGSTTAAVVNTTGATVDNVAYTYAGTAATSTVSVGSVGAERTLTNVAAGRVDATSTDAINGSQLFATDQAVDALGVDVDTVGTTTAASLGGTSAYDAATHTVTAGLDVDGTTHTTVQDALTQLSDTANAGWNVTDGTTAANIGPDGTVTFTGDSNLTVAQTGVDDAGAVEITLNENIDLGPAGSVTTGEAVLSNAGVTVGPNVALGNTGLTIAGGPSVTTTGIDAGGAVITNVAPGVAGTDGVSVDQLTDATTAVQTHYYSVNDNGVQGGNYDNDGATGINALAAGVDASATVDSGTALGNGAVAGAQAGDVALGSGSTTAAVVNTAGATVDNVAYTYAGTAATSTVSVGSVGADRTLTNVAAGRVDATSTDAINGSQLFATDQAVDALGDNVDTVGTTTAASLGGTSAYDPATHAVTAGLDVDGTTYTTVQDALTQVSDTASAGWNISAQGANATNVAPDETVDLNNSDGNIVVSKTATDDDVTFDLADDIAVDSVTAGGTVVDGTGLTIAGGPSVTLAGIDAGGLVIGNVAPGVAATDAVNVSQLTGLSETPMTFTGNAGTVDRLLGEELLVTGAATSPGTYSGANLRTEVVGNELQIQMTDQPVFGAVSVNTAGAGTINGLTNQTFDPDNYTSGQAATEDQLKQISDTTNAGWNVTDGTSTANIGPNGTVTFTGDSNLTVAQTGADDAGEVEITLNETIDLGPAGSVTTGDTVLSNTGVTVGPDVALGSTGLVIAGGPSVTATGIDAGGLVIGNVAPGVAGTDAVNVDQLTDAVSSAQTKYYHVNSTGGGNENSDGATGVDAIAVGKDASAGGNEAMALGLGASADGDGSLALGSGATASHGNSVALGAGSATLVGAQANYEGAYVGASSSTGEMNIGGRQITGVAAGSADTDAVNVSQLQAGVESAVAESNAYTDTQIDTVNDSVNQLGDRVTTVEGDVANLDDRVNNVEGDVTNLGTTVNQFDDRITGVEDSVTALQQGGVGAFRASADSSTVAPSATGTNSSAGGAGAAASGENAVAVGNQSTASADNSTAVGTGAEATHGNSVALGAGSATTVGAQSGYNAAYVGNSTSAGEVNVGGRTVSGVAAGVAGTDAVNVNQLNSGVDYAINQANSYTDSRIDGLQSDVWTLERGYRGATASAMAMAGLPQAYLPGKNMLGVALGGYQGEGGMAVGLSGITENGRFVYKVQASGNTTREWGFSVGAGIQW